MMGSPPAPPARRLGALAVFLLALFLAAPWGVDCGYNVASVAGSKNRLRARLELAGGGGGAAPELGPDVRRLSLTARQV
jgi:hypothetical protein